MSDHHCSHAVQAPGDVQPTCSKLEGVSDITILSKLNHNRVKLVDSVLDI